MIFPASHRPLTISRSGRTCYGFAWLGQPFSSCDNCGHPYWHHSHEITTRAIPGRAFGRTLRKIITVEEAIGCYEKWGTRSD